MSEYVKLANGAADQYLAALADVQDRFLNLVELWTPRQIIETNFSFTEKWLKQQKAFSERLLGMIAAKV
jgi:hypothetical protein